MSTSGHGRELPRWRPAGATKEAGKQRFFRYAALQMTDGGLFVFFDDNLEVPTMKDNAEYHQFEIDEWDRAFGFAMKRARVKVSEIRAGKKGEKKTHLLFIRDPEDRLRPRTIHHW